MQEAIIALVWLLVGAGLVGAAGAAGYWAGRNSIERPFRSGQNPAAPGKANREAQGEPETGDFYQDAAFGDDNSPVPTIQER